MSEEVVDTSATETEVEVVQEETTTQEGVDSQATETPNPSDASEGFGSSLLGEFAQEEGEEAKESESESKEAEKEVKEQGAPEEYESFKTPTGEEMDNRISDEFKLVARELNLTQDKAQTIIDRMGKVIAQNQFDTVKAISDQWRKESEEDPEIGGSKLEESRAHIGRLVRTFGRGADGKIDSDIAAFMALPSCNHKGLLKLLSRAGRSIGEAKFPQGGAKDGVGVTDIYNMKL